MEQRALEIAQGKSRELLWFVEHKPLYTLGVSARAHDLLNAHDVNAHDVNAHDVNAQGFEVHNTKRGGQITYHGPGQRVAYCMLDLRTRGRDVRRFVCELESWLIESLAQFGVRAERRQGRVGIWVCKPDGMEVKIAAIGLRIKRWVSFHGIALNVHPNLTHYNNIVPCGLREFGVTSLHDLGIEVSMQEVDIVLRACFETRFGITQHVPFVCDDTSKAL